MDNFFANSIQQFYYIYYIYPTYKYRIFIFTCHFFFKQIQENFREISYIIDY